MPDLSALDPSLLARQPWYLSAVWWLLLVLLVMPVGLFLARGWVHRRRDIISSISPVAAALYLGNFQANADFRRLDTDPDAATKAFNHFYTDRFGRWRYFWPVLLTVVLAGFLLAFPLHLATLALSGDAPANPVAWVVGFAILGGYTRVVYELTVRFYQDNIRPADLLWGSYRLIISVPLGYTVGLMVNTGATAHFAATAAFLLGLFPTTTVSTWGRRLFAKWTGTPDMDSDHPQQLKVLPALDTDTMELITQEGLTTFTQLAYADPIRVSIRTGLSFSFVVTAVSEAMLATQLLTRANMETARRFGIWGGYEAVGMWQQFNNPDQPDHEIAKRIVADLATALNYPRDGLVIILAQISNDPYVLFIRECWGSNIVIEEHLRNQPPAPPPPSSPAAG